MKVLMASVRRPDGTHPADDGPPRRGACVEHARCPRVAGPCEEGVGHGAGGLAESLFQRPKTPRRDMS
eukprot:CAMPEP_0181440864 /NCGR_PEP_ID=MMETSP1110-20121109/23200_1 /TAXON_ID=174948 /ORGANISM="Symbiodinium sp., Strain CCMP421" /LENGTH=67 /DNA_ID=CAMNT_0023564707 /DNA_START=544 /DNA_END=748 /DNA_ORIENTATION=-